jgi:deuterolysin
MIPIVQLCVDYFLQEPSDQAAILLHELTHVSSDTVDYVYSEPALLALARNHPEQAVRNAANFAAFAESVAFGRTPGRREERSDDPE